MRVVRRIFANITISLLLMIISISCVHSNYEQTDPVRRVSVGLDMLMPLVDLPSTKSVSDDISINDYAIWVFSDNKFLEAIYKGDTYEEDNQSHPMVTLQNDGKMFVLLPEGLKNVTLAMVANLPDIKSNEPTVGTSIDAANVGFGYDVTYMPMYGRNSNVFDVAVGANAGVIVLRRAMAKIEVNATKASDHFTLQNMYVFYPNRNGTVQEVPVIKNDPDAGHLTGVVNANKAHIYVPEINIKAQTSSKSCIILEGLYEGEKMYYKLDFIPHTITGNVVYPYIEKLERNYRYIFDVQYLTAGTGYHTVAEAITNNACNIVPEGNVKLMWIDDVNINDITTNNYIYLGLTSSDVRTFEGAAYHVANVSIVTNSDKGWKFESPLPSGVEVSIPEYTPALGSGVEIVSVWIYLDLDKYPYGSVVTVYVYGENIRKSIALHVLPESDVTDNDEWDVVGL